MAAGNRGLNPTGTPASSRRSCFCLPVWRWPCRPAQHFSLDGAATRAPQSSKAAFFQADWAAATSPRSSAPASSRRSCFWLTAYIWWWP